MTRKSNSFTLVEIIAVLLVIAILAAVAAPKFINLADEARIGVARAGLNEAKASLSVAFHKAYLQKVNAGTDTSTITATEVLDASGLTSPVTFGDIVVTMVADGQTVNLTATTVDEVDIAVASQPKATWTVPTDYE